MNTTLRLVRFGFDDNPLHTGYATGSTWNGWDNIKVSAPTRAALVSELAAEMGEDEPTVGDLARLPVGQDGLVDLSHGYACQVDEAATAAFLLGVAIKAATAAVPTTPTLRPVPS